MSDRRDSRDASSRRRPRCGPLSPHPVANSSRAAFETAQSKWLAELRHHAPTTPIILVGCALDQRGDRSVVDSLARHGRGFVSQEQARSFSQQVRAAACLETSARTLPVAPVFELATKIWLQQSRLLETTSPGQTLQREPRPGDPLWDQIMAPLEPLLTGS